MQIGDIILVSFPFAESSNQKVRPAVVITETLDKYHDFVVSAISSVVQERLSRREILLHPNTTNNLRARSVLIVDRIVTIRNSLIITKIGSLSSDELEIFRKILIDIANE